MVASVAATVVGRHYLGDAPAFEVPQHSVESSYELFAYAVLGILAGLAALAFTRILYFAEDLFDKAPIWPPIKTLLGGALALPMAVLITMPFAKRLFAHPLPFLAVLTKWSRSNLKASKLNTLCKRSSNIVDGSDISPLIC